VIVWKPSLTPRSIHAGTTLTDPPRQTLKLRLFDKEHPIYTEPRTLPPTKVQRPKKGGLLSECAEHSPTIHSPNQPNHHHNNHNNPTTTQMTDTFLEDCMLGDGCRVTGSTLRGCVIGSCSFIDRGCDLQVRGRDTPGAHCVRIALLMRVLL